ncbi:MAG: hypothetical protein JSS14_15815 [Proteobacteria bacterium]|nr:hypothetical protein [Pseudomonadota bacterium]
MFEIKVPTKEIKSVTLSVDDHHQMRTAYQGALTILATETLAQRNLWVEELNKAGVQPLCVTVENVDPKHPDPALVKELASSWMPTATKIEDEMFVGWVASEPTPFVRAVSAYLSKHDPAKGKLFDKEFFKHLS